MSPLRTVIGATLRRRRQEQARTLREVADAAGVSLTYLSEVERGRKEASSEVLEAVCAALDLALSELLHEVAEELARLEVHGSLSRVGFVPSPAPPRPAQPRPAHGAPTPRAVPAHALLARPASAAAQPPAGAPAEPAATAAPVARVIDLRAFAGRRSA